MASRNARFTVVSPGGGANSAGDSEQTSRPDFVGVGVGYDRRPGVVASTRFVTYRVWAYVLSASAFCGTTLYAMYQFIGR